VTAVVFLGWFVSGGVLYVTKGFNSRLTDRTQLLADTGKFDGSYVRELELEDIPGNLTRLGGTNAPPQLLVWGDSHAMAILPAIDSLCRESGTTAVAATHAGTAPVVGYFSRNQWGLNEKSIPFNAAIMDHIQSGKFRTILLVSYWKMHCEVPEFQAALLKTVDQLRAAGVSVYLMKDLPIYDFDVSKSLVRYSYRGLDLGRLGLTPAELQAEDKFPTLLEQQLKERAVHILEPIPVLQARTKSVNFLPYDSGGSFYFDSNHLSTYGSLALKPLFVSLFRSLAAGGESHLTTGLRAAPEP
jgi:SGNH domain (fused to AT3 domains)